MGELSRVRRSILPMPGDGWGEIARRHPDQTLVLRYEDFRRDPLENLRRLAAHFGLDLSDADLEAGIAVGSKDMMARHQDPNVDEKPVRPDGAGSTRFSPADLAALGAILDRHLRHDFGYAYFARPRGYQIPGVVRDRPAEARSCREPEAAQAPARQVA